ncbi:hypothetical protein FRB94_010632 [Tulasnella sp. JGI-2019a]|nr:hypothetical protein FRB94_010632 [Tulasnella sp. JGI-2019a]KAG9017820.1 hypothetical protein FRB93_004631 [Tulasnella sp. JGI-2019a]KAG9035443.1 hypothetical protein FRB95_011308 [Tulasnella sp. JGI-2019a]
MPATKIVADHAGNPGHSARRHTLGIDIALHICLFMFSIAAGATSAAFVYDHAPPWVFPCTTTITALTTIYSACYVYFYTNRSYFLSIKALALLALFWCLALILPWIFVASTVYKIARLTRWTSLAHASLAFCTLSIVTLTLVPPASYHRYRADAAFDNQQELLNHHLPSPRPAPLPHRSFLDIVNHYPDDYAFRELRWCQQSDVYSHQFIVAMFESRALPAHRLYVRVEREKAKWMPGDALETLFNTSSFEEILIGRSFCIARYTVDVTSSRRAGHTLASIGEVINDINQYSSDYSLLAYNCWWFAGCSFICIAHRIEFCHPTVYRRRESHHQLEKTTFDGAMAFCYTHYLRGHWSYWILVGHPLVTLIAFLSLVSDWCYLAYTIPPTFMAAWLTYYIVSIARSWGVVRGVVGPHGNAVGVGKACKGVIVVVGLMLYSAVVLALVSNPALAITARTERRGS